MKKLEGKIAVVTGGNSGIGLATAKLLRQQGATVAISGRDQETLDAASKEIGDGTLALRADISSPHDLDAFFATVLKAFGNIDILFANAGVAKFAAIGDTTEEFFDEIFGINVRGTFFTIKKSLPYLNDGAAIVLNTSFVDRTGLPGSSVYAASKAALRSFVRVAAAELVGRGIRVNAVSPGPIATPIFGKLGMSKEEVDGLAGVILGRVPMKRLGAGEDMPTRFRSSPVQKQRILPVSSSMIGFRLSAWYFLVFACGIAALSVAAWYAMRASLYHAIDEALEDRVRGVQTFMDKQISALSVPEIRDEFREHSVLGPGGDLFQVCDETGQLLYRSIPLESNNVPIAAPGTLSKPRYETMNVQGHQLRFYSRRISVDGKSYTVQVAATVDEALEALERFRVILAFAAPLLLVAASAGGYWISTRALAPVDEISHAAQRISIENLTDRLQVPQTGDQLQRLSETLNEMLSRLEASVRRMTQFTADASHELRAPVSLIRTTAEVAVLRRDRPAEEYLEALDDILEESERTSQVVDSLMLLARTDSGKEMLECAPVDACAIVRSAAEQGERLARNQDVEFSIEVPVNPVPIQADAEVLRRALLILMDNAAKYTPRGGSIQVALGQNNGFAIASVSDTGIGIEPQDLPHVFDRFWRADKARSREQGGAGLGLSIAKWIVDMHGGSISLESKPGKGSVFAIRVPLVVGTH
jgi:heavy metal sensor kinase